MTDVCVGDAASDAFLPCKGHAVARENGMNAIRGGHKHLSKELRCIGFCGPVRERDIHEFLDAIYGDKHLLFAAGELHFGAVNVHGAQRCFFKLSVPSRHLHCGLSTDSVTLQARCRALRLSLSAVSSSCAMRSSSDRYPCLRNAIARCSCSWLALSCGPEAHRAQRCGTPLRHGLRLDAVELGEGPMGTGR